MTAFLTETNDVSTRSSAHVWVHPFDPLGIGPKLPARQLIKVNLPACPQTSPGVICTYVLRTSRETATRNSKCLRQMSKDNWSHFWSSFTFKGTSQVICSNEGTKSGPWKHTFLNAIKVGPSLRQISLRDWAKRSWWRMANDCLLENYLEEEEDGILLQSRWTSSPNLRFHLVEIDWIGH